MARKHVIQFYLEQQALYLQMLDTVKQIDDDFKSGKIDFERHNQLLEVLTPDIEVIKSNYERLSYIVLLLNKPQKEAKGSNYEKVNKELYDSLQTSTREALLDESKDALADLKRIIKESKETK